MIKFSLLICIFFVIFHNGNSEQLDFGKFFGGCPEVSPSPRPVFEGEGEWYTHRLASGFSPWKYLRCQSSVFNFRSNDDEPSTVKTTFSLPILPFSFEIGGTVEKFNDGDYAFKYRSLVPVLGSVPQKTAVLLDYGNAALVYTCLDFKLFHLDTVQVMSKFKDSSAINNNEANIRSAINGARRFGVSPGSFVEIDQSC